VASLRSEIQGLMIDAADVRAVARDEIQAIRIQLQAISAACSDAKLAKMIIAAQHQVAEADDAIAGQVAFLAQDLELLMAGAQSQEVRHA
jgi:hypothetical protein